jgi:hypothetical protein
MITTTTRPHFVQQWSDKAFVIMFAPKNLQVSRPYQTLQDAQDNADFLNTEREEHQESGVGDYWN